MQTLNKINPPNAVPLGLFLNAHMNGAQEAERSLGVVEKLLMDTPRNNLLLGCKAALLLNVQHETGLIENDPLFQRKALEMTQGALKQADTATALQIRLMNGLAWSRLNATETNRRHVLSYLKALEEPFDAAHLPPLMVLEGFVALSVLYQDLGQDGASADRFRAASEIDRVLACNRYEVYRNKNARQPDGRVR